MQKMLIWIIALGLTVPQAAFAEDGSSPSVAPPANLAASSRSGNALVRQVASVNTLTVAALREAARLGASPVAQLSQQAPPPPRRRNVKRAVIWSTVIGAALGGLFYNIAVECGSNAGNECSEYWARGGAVGGGIGALGGLVWAYSK